MRTFLKIFFCLTVALAVAGPFFAGAVSSTAPYDPPDLPINTNLPIPNEMPISGDTGQGPAALIANFYSFAFLIAGFLAFAMIIYGGVRYTFSGGNHSSKEEGKESIKQALFGMALLLVAYLILRTINPDLTVLNLPTLAPYNPPPSSSSTGPGPGAFACGSSCSCQQYLQNHASVLTACTPTPDVSLVIQCIGTRVSGVSPSAVADHNHTNDSCHFGGPNCVGSGHAFDYGIVGVGGAARLAQVKTAAEQCGRGTSNDVTCFYENAQGQRHPGWTENTPGITHIHCNVNVARDNCGCH